jgi:uncharacterized protein YdhG (YjbR/CyaY superfamily)
MLSAQELDEFARLLEEFTSFRQETRERFDRVDADISEITPEALQAVQSASMWCVVHGAAIAP